MLRRVSCLLPMAVQRALGPGMGSMWTRSHRGSAVGRTRKPGSGLAAKVCSADGRGREEDAELPPEPVIDRFAHVCDCVVSILPTPPRIPMGCIRASTLCSRSHPMSVPDTLDIGVCCHLGGCLHVSPLPGLVSAKWEIQVGNGWDNTK